MGVVRTGRVVVRAERVVVRTGRVVVRADHGGWVAPKAVDIATTWANHTHRCSAARLPALRAAGVACCGHCVAVGIAWLRALRGCGHCTSLRRCVAVGTAWLWALRGCGHCVAAGTASLRALRGCGHCASLRRCVAAALRGCGHCVAASRQVYWDGGQGKWTVSAPLREVATFDSYRLGSGSCGASLLSRRAIGL